MWWRINNQRHDSDDDVVDDDDSGVVMLFMIMRMILEDQTVWRRYVERKEWGWFCDSFAGCLLKQRISSQSKVIFTTPPEKLTS